jgi:hypothetical protein
MSFSPGANHCLPLSIEPKLSIHLILRSDAQRRVSKDDSEGIARFASAGAPFEAPSGRLRARGTVLLATRGLR